VVRISRTANIKTCGVASKTAQPKPPWVPAGQALCTFFQPANRSTGLCLSVRRTSDEVEIEDSCPQNLELRWMSEVQSSVYATPLITDLFSDGHKDIVVPSFVHHLEVRSQMIYTSRTCQKSSLPLLPCDSPVP